MEKVIEKTRKISPRIPTPVSIKTPEKVSKTTTHPDCPGIEFDENGDPVGCYTVVEIFDELDRQFVEFFGEEGRRMANVRRKRWNKKGTWHFDLF